MALRDRSAAAELDPQAAIELLTEKRLVRKAGGISVREAKSAIWTLEPCPRVARTEPRIPLDVGTIRGGACGRSMRGLLLADNGAYSRPCLTIVQSRGRDD